MLGIVGQYIKVIKPTFVLFDNYLQHKLIWIKVALNICRLFQKE